MKFKYALTSLALSVAILSSVPSTAFAIGGASGAKVDYQVQGKIGEVVMNPYDIAPLTAVIRNGGFQFPDGPLRGFTQKKSQGSADKSYNKKLFTYWGVFPFCFFPGLFNNALGVYTKNFSFTHLSPPTKKKV